MKIKIKLWDLVFVSMLIDVVWQLFSQIFEDKHYHSITDLGKLVLRLTLMILLIIALYRRIYKPDNKRTDSFH